MARKLNDNLQEKFNAIKRSIMQRELIDTMFETTWSWVLMFSFIILMDKSVSIFSGPWIALFLLGWFLLIEIFGLFNFLTRKIFLIYFMKREKVLTREDIDRMGNICNIYWFTALYLASYYALNLIKEIIS